MQAENALNGRTSATSQVTGPRPPRTRDRSTTVTSTSTSSTVRQAHISSQAQTPTGGHGERDHREHRTTHSRSHQNLRAASASTLGRTASNMSNSPTPTGPGSRSRSGSAARYLSVNTAAAAAAGPLPVLPTLTPQVMHALEGASPNIDAVAPGGTLGLTPTTISPHSAATSAVTGTPTLGNEASHSGAISPASVSPALTMNPPPSAGGRDRSLTHKSSSRTVGGSSINGNQGRKSSSASTTKPKDASRTRDRREKDSSNGKSKSSRSAAGGAASSITSPGEDGDDEDGYRPAPRLHLHDVPAAPPTLMYWSRAPVWGVLPKHKMRSHSATVVDNTMIWLFGGCDDREFWRDILCLDIETMEWTHPETVGDVPPPCRAHTATLVDRRIFIFGGGQGNMYYNTLYILDTISRRWTHVSFSANNANSTHTAPSHSHTLSAATSPSNTPLPPMQALKEPEYEEETVPRPRRAHTTVLYKNKLVVFGGGNGATALNDVWVLDVSVPPERMRWAQIRTSGTKPTPRGYHTANLVGNMMIIVGGSDGRQTFSEIYCLNLDTWVWSAIHPVQGGDRFHRRLAHRSTLIGSYLFITGGHDGSQYTNDLLLFNLLSLQYEPRPTRGIPPSARGYHAATLADGRLWIFGGYDGRVAYDDVHMLDLASSAYLSQVTGFSIDVVSDMGRRA